MALAAEQRERCGLVGEAGGIVFQRHPVKVDALGVGSHCAFEARRQRARACFVRAVEQIEPDGAVRIVERPCDLGFFDFHFFAERSA